MLDWLSLTTVPVDLLAADGLRCGRASGFFYGQDENDLFLITNWHVVSGRDPYQPNVTKHDYRVPTKARLRLHSRTDRKDAISLTKKVEYTIDINDACGDKPVWLEHPVHHQKADIVLIKLDRKELDVVAVFKSISECDLSPEYKEAVTDDVFIIGYPWGLHGGDHVLPLYKRGSIASEPEIDQQGLPRFLVDCRTADAMSGSPVICSHSGIWMPNGAMDDKSVVGTVKKFVGVYSGRLYEHDTEQGKLPAATEIGQVWKVKAINELATSGVPARKFSEL